MKIQLIIISLVGVAAGACQQPAAPKQEEKAPAATAVLHPQAAPTDSVYIAGILDFQHMADHRLTEKYTRNLDEVGGEGGEAVYYVYQGDTLKMEATLFREMGRETHRFYQLKKQLVLYTLKQEQYKEPIFVSKKTVVIATDTDRIIFRNGQMIHCLHNGRPADEKTFREKAVTLRELHTMLITTGN